MPGFLKIGKNGKSSPSAMGQPTEAQQVAAAASAAPLAGADMNTLHNYPYHQQQPQQQAPGHSGDHNGEGHRRPRNDSKTSLVAQLEAAAERQGWERQEGAHGSSQPPASSAFADSRHTPMPASQSASQLPRPPVMAAAMPTGMTGSSSHGALDAAVKQTRINGSQPSAQPSAFAGLDFSRFGAVAGASMPQRKSAPSPPPRDELQDEDASSFFGGDEDANDDYAAASGFGPSTVPYPMTDGDEVTPREQPAQSRTRPSSFFGMEQPVVEQTQAAKFAAAHRVNKDGADGATDGARSSPVSLAPSQSVSQTGGGSGGTSTRPESIAPSTGGALLDHSHLRPGQQAALLSHNKTLELYRQNAKKTNDPDLMYEFAVFMIDAAKTMGGDDSSGGSGPPGASGSSGGHQGKEEAARDELVKEAMTLLRKVADRGHPNAQYFLGDCYANGFGTHKGKPDYDRAYALFVLAAKHNHADAAYRAGMSYEKGWGCRKDNSKAVLFYRKAASQSHPGALFRLGTAELNGELGLKKSAREGVKWLKRAAEAATPEFPYALHELALLHERGIDNVIYADEDYACELLAQAGELGYAPSAYRLGVNYEYGRMGCPQDPGLSIHMYNIAAQQNHREACFALTAWYLVGAPGILPQSDTEAYLWAKKAAEQGLAKAEYSVGYFTESGIGTVRDLPEAKAWYKRAAEHGDKRANQRLASIGGPIGFANSKSQASGLPSTSPPKNGDAREPGIRWAAQPRGNTGGAPQSSYPTPFAMRETQTRERHEARQALIQYHQEKQQRQEQRQSAAPRSSTFGQPPPSNASLYSSSQPSPRDMPRAPFAGPSSSSSYAGSFGGPPPSMNGRPMPPHQRRQASGSDSYNTYNSNGPASSSGHGPYNNNKIAAQRNLSQPTLHSQSGSAPSHQSHQPSQLSQSPPQQQGSGPGGSWNPLANWASYARGNKEDKQQQQASDAQYSVPVIRQPMPPSKGQRRSPPAQESYGGPGQYMRAGQQESGPSSPVQSEDGRRKSLWKQLKAM